MIFFFFKSRRFRHKINHGNLKKKGAGMTMLDLYTVN